MALLIGVGMFVFSSSAEARIYPQRSIAGVKLGMSKKQVRAKLGKPSKTARTSVATTFYYRGIRVSWVSGRGVTNVRSTTKRQKTRTGVTVGSTKRQVKRGVAAVVCGKGVCRVTRGYGGTRATDFVLKRRRVVRITLRFLDKDPPTAPTGLAATGATKTSITLGWQASRDNIAVVQYRLSRSGIPIAKSARTGAVISGLSCGASYELSVDAADAAGNRSPSATIEASTSPCPATGDVRISPDGSNANPCTQQAPCRTFNRAYRAASPGDVVDVAAGDYPGEVITPDLTKTSGDAVIFRPAGGSVRVVGTLEIRAAHLELRDLKIRRLGANYRSDNLSWARANHLTFRNLDLNTFAFNSVQNVWIVGGDVGPNNDPVGKGPDDGGFIGTWPANLHPSGNILIEDVLFHDISAPRSTSHSDCLQFTAGVRVIIRGNRFERCAHADIMIKRDQGPIKTFLVENNVLDRTTQGYFSINLNNTMGCKNVLIRFNSALQGIRTDACPGARVESNILPSMTSWQCNTSTARLDYNVFSSGTPCGAHDIVSEPGFVDPSVLDLRLLPDAAAIDSGHPARFPARDIIGSPRPVGAAPDVGAFEAP